MNRNSAYAQPDQHVQPTGYDELAQKYQSAITGLGSNVPYQVVRDPITGRPRIITSEQLLPDKQYSAALQDRVMQQQLAEHKKQLDRAKAEQAQKQRSEVAAQLETEKIWREASRSRAGAKQADADQVRKEVLSMIDQGVPQTELFRYFTEMNPDNPQAAMSAMFFDLINNPKTKIEAQKYWDAQFGGGMRSLNPMRSPDLGFYQNVQSLNPLAFLRGSFYNNPKNLQADVMRANPQSAYQPFGAQPQMPMQQQQAPQQGGINQLAESLMMAAQSNPQFKGELEKLLQKYNNQSK